MLDAIAESLRDYVVTWRRLFHSQPEIGWCEYGTTYRIVNELSRIGWSVRYGRDILPPGSRIGLPSQDDQRIAVERAIHSGIPEAFMAEITGGLTGCVAEMDTGKAGPTVALRFDIDALRIQESRNQHHRPHLEGFSSIYPGIMHACAHDGHAAIGLGLGTMLFKLRDHISGKVRLLFQPAEEGCRGASSMVKGGATEGVDYLVGIHIGMKADTTGSVIAAVNGLMATRKFDIKFTGKPAHAGMNPQLGRNALLAAATAVLNIHAAPQHEEGLSRVNVGSLLADGERNVIPSEAFLRVETRGSNERVEDHVYQHAIRSINGAAQSYGVEFGLETLGRASNANCDLDLSRMIRDAASLSTGVSNVIDILEDYGGCDDFSIMMNSAQEAKAKACFTCIGSNLASGHHQPDFDFDEESLLIGIELLAHAVDLLSNLDCGASRIDRL